MDVNVVVTRRRQVDRTAATRAAFVAAGRKLFAEHGYAEVGTERLAHAAGVTRGALYHQFADKADLFAAVVEAIEIDLTQPTRRRRRARRPMIHWPRSSPAPTPGSTRAASPRCGASCCSTGPPSSVGSAGGRSACATDSAWSPPCSTELMEAGAIPAQPVEAMAHVLIGAIDEAALYVALAADPARARAEAGAVLRRLVAAVTAPL